MYVLCCAQSCPALSDPIDYSPPGSSPHEMLQARILEWIACPSAANLPDPGIKPTSLMSPALAGEFFTTSATWKALCRFMLMYGRNHHNIAK